jgi:hypothetical protein
MTNYADALADLTTRKMLDIAREQEMELVRACRRGEPYVDFPNEFNGDIERKILTTTTAGQSSAPLMRFPMTLSTLSTGRSATRTRHGGSRTGWKCGSWFTRRRAATPGVGTEGRASICLRGEGPSRSHLPTREAQSG